MTREELIQNLDFLAYQFKRFEDQYNLVVSLPQNKKGTYSDKSKKTVKSITSGTSFVGFFILGIFLMFIPGLIGWGVIVMIIEKIFNLRVGDATAFCLWLIAWLVLAITFAVLMSKKVTKKAINKMDSYNSGVVSNNINIDNQVAVAEQNCVAIRNEIARLDLSWYPPDYSYSQAASSFASYLRNQRVNTLGEAVNLFETERYRNAVTANQRQQIQIQKQQLAAAWMQCILQQQTIDSINRQGEMTRQTINMQGQTTRETITSAATSAAEATKRASGDIRRGLDNIRDELRR